MKIAGGADNVVWYLNNNNNRNISNIVTFGLNTKMIELNFCYADDGTTDEKKES